MKLILDGPLKARLLADFGVTLNEIEECFLNRTTSFERISTGEGTCDSCSFVAKTNRGRILKIEFTIKEKLLHVLQLPDRTVTMEQDGVFCEVTAVNSFVQLNQLSNL